MATETESAGDPVAEESVRQWRPSRRPEHLIPREQRAERVHITERQRPSRSFALLRSILARPMAKAIIVICLLVVGAIIFDATVNRGTWTQRQVQDRPVRMR